MTPWTVKATGHSDEAGRGVDAAEVRRALAALADPAAAIQLQAAPLWAWRTVPGRDIDAQVAWVEREGRTAVGVYYALNPVAPTLADRVKSSDVLRRRWLLIDIDRFKTAETLKLSATEAEHAAARSLSVDVWPWLTASFSFPEPVIVDSGNGFHLLYRIDLPNDEVSRRLVKDCLAAVAAKFDGPQGTIGVECHDARRIAKLPGTWARKGPGDDRDRPWRLARMLNCPEPIRVVPAETLAKLAGTVPAKAVVVPAVTPRKKAAPFVATAGQDREIAYARKALESECEIMRTAQPGNLNNQIRDSHFALGRFVAAGLLTDGEILAALKEAGRAAGCDDPKKDDDTARRSLEAGKQRALTIPERNGSAAHAAKGAGKSTAADGGEKWVVLFNGEVLVEGPPGEVGAAAHATTGPRVREFEMLTLDRLIARDFPEPNWAIPGLLAEGLNLLVGSPKMGKSMLALNLALAVASGGKALGNVQTAPGDVLYLSLEDKQRRIKARAVKMIGQDKWRGAGARLTLATDWPRVDQGGLDLINRWIDKVERPVMFIVDVLGRFRPGYKSSGNQYEQDSNHLYGIKQFADSKNLSSLVLHHTRKSQSKGKDKGDEDEFEAISGTQGIAGACDGIIMLKRIRRASDAIITVTGRDDADQQLAIQFDLPTLTWTSLGSAEEFLGGKLQKAIVDYLKAIKTPSFVSDIAAKTEATDGSVRKALFRLLEKGMIRKHGNAWAWPSDDVAAF